MRAPALLSGVLPVVMVKQGVEQHGQLGEHPLVELLRETSAAGLSGALRLAHERVKCVIYFEDGALVFAVSNLRAARLAESARRWKFVTEQELAEAGEQASDVKLGEALVRSGALTPDRLSELLSVQTLDVLRPALLWTEGTWSFDPRVRLAEDVRLAIPLSELLAESARRLPTEFITQRFSNTNERVSLVADAPMEVELQPVEGFVLSRIDAKGMRLHELMTVSGLPEEETLRAVYVLASGGFLTRDNWRRAFTDEQVARFKAAIAAEKQKEAEAVAETAVAPEQPAVEVEQKQAIPEPTPAPPEPEVLPEVDERQELEQFLTRMDAAEDHYEALGVTRSVDASGVKRAYHALARRFHPDRFHQEAGTPLHARLQTAFARVAQAYETLRDAKVRSSYDLRLEAQKKMRRPASFSKTGHQGGAQAAGESSAGRSSSAAASQGQAEENFRQGLHALKSGNLAVALSLLSDAARRAPKEARYRALYGRALATNRQMRHQAEAEFQAAISLDAKNPSYRIMLAQLYRDLGMKRRAQGEAQRALSIDAGNAEAQRLLEELNGKE